MYLESRCQKLSKKPDHEQGSVIVLVALFMTVFLGMCAMVVDIGALYAKQSQLQNAIDSAVLAAAQELPNTTNAKVVADQYMVLNGFSPTDAIITFSEANKRINISGSKQVNYVFAAVLGFNSSIVSTSASATNGSAPNAFKYALFSGSTSSTLVLNGSNQTVTGDSHSNEDFLANGSKILITGACEAVETVVVNGSNISLGTIVENAPFIDMPDFSDTIKTLATEAGQNYVGNKTYNGSNIDVNSPIYVTGNLTVNGSHFYGKGTIVATGTIDFNGSNLYNSGDDSVCFYSKSGNITINGSNAVLNGMVYAPNGTVTMNGSNQTVYGRVIGNKVTINGSNLNITSGDKDLKSLPFGGVKLVR